MEKNQRANNPAPGPRGFRYTERHLQCVWFDAALRPAALTTGQGAKVTVEHPGQWNLEEGPDFLGAVLRVGSESKPRHGDVEIHIRPGDWQRHGHARNPLYDRVIAHVTYFPGILPAASLPAGAIQIALKDALSANPFFSFESLDLTAYPYAVRGPETPCACLLKKWDPDRVASLLETAGAERLAEKAARMAGAIMAKGAGQALYEEVMAALGYKNNRAPFRRLAEQLPLETLRELSAGVFLKAYALLLGVAGLLPVQAPARWDAATRSFVRQLWDHWWKHQDAWGARALHRKDWKLSGLRPANYPQRRLMLAAALFAAPDQLLQGLAALSAGQPDAAFKAMIALLQPDVVTYWQNRLTFAGKTREKTVALMGAGRAAAIIVNVFVPFLAALGKRGVLGEKFLQHLPPEENNQVLRQTAHNLLGADHNPAFYRTALRRQGLIRIFQNFCLTDRSRCMQCPLLDTLQGAKGQKQ